MLGDRGIFDALQRITKDVTAHATPYTTMPNGVNSEIPGYADTTFGKGLE
jgi:hypothetical protein